ncbi:MAG: hypothetical protein QNJ12_02295 [Ilumatobacter sp.]|uniref:hypothetical protein n=1 Tax=Ilumatobacter sp. TaxID=1967498 RepID=UPI00260AED76|nr:hypothetical protein [Ilumatobacter sp.]MDJ0767587.1 hypothetical protein [Ilumatobacter sp.]
MTIRVRSLLWFATGVVLAVVATAVVMNTWRVEAAPGDDDTTFVPMQPCRLIDTRTPQDDIWGPNVTQSLPAHGTNGRCTIPFDATGLSMNVTAFEATEPTHLTIWPDDETRPEVSSLNPVPGQPPTPNAVTTELSPGGRFKVFNLAGHVHVIIDVNGYYTASSLQELSTRVEQIEPSMRFAQVDADPGTASLLRGNGVRSVHHSLAGLYQVDFDDPVDRCAWLATRNSIDPTGVPTPGEITVELRTPTDRRSLWVRTYDSTGKQIDMTNPDGFSLHVMC